MFIQSRELGAKHCALPFTEPIIRAVDVMAVEPLSRHPATIVDGPSEEFELIIVGDDRTTFAGRHELASLKAERACAAACPHSSPVPFTAVCVSTIFHES